MVILINIFISKESTQRERDIFLAIYQVHIEKFAKFVELQICKHNFLTKKRFSPHFNPFTAIHHQVPQRL